MQITIIYTKCGETLSTTATIGTVDNKVLELKLAGFIVLLVSARS